MKKEKHVLPSKWKSKSFFLLSHLDFLNIIGLFVRTELSEGLNDQQCKTYNELLYLSSELQNRETRK